MQVLKGVGLGLIGFVLFVALLVLGLTFTIYNTALNPQFAANEVDKIDIPGSVHEVLANFLPDQDKAYLSGIDQTLVETMPWIYQQINYVIYGSYDYLLGKTDSFSLSFTTQPLQQSLVRNLTRVFLQSPPAEYSQLSSIEKDRYITQFQQQITSSIPSNVEINRDLLGVDVMNSLLQVRNIFAYIRTGYFVLIALTLILILLIALLLRDAKGILRSLGIIFIVVGVLSSAIVFGLKYFVPGVLPLSNLPHGLQTWIPVVFNDLISPWEIFSISFFIGGLVLLISSFFLLRIWPVFTDRLPT